MTRPAMASPVAAATRASCGSKASPPTACPTRDRTRHADARPTPMASAPQSDADALAIRLRAQIHAHVLPSLAAGLAGARRLKRPRVHDLADTYRITLTVLLR